MRNYTETILNEHSVKIMSKEYLKRAIKFNPYAVFTVVDLCVSMFVCVCVHLSVRVVAL